MMDRALELDEVFDGGAIHTFMIGFESVGQGARRHVDRAMELSGGADAAPLLAFAEAVCNPQQHRDEFVARHHLPRQHGTRLSDPSGGHESIFHRVPLQQAAAGGIPRRATRRWRAGHRGLAGDVRALALDWPSSTV